MSDLPFHIELDGGTCEVVHDPNLQHEGEMRPGFRDPVIALREYDERVLLHEVLHVLIQTAELPPVSGETEEWLVRRLTRGLFGMGWRWRVRSRGENKAEQERDALFRANEVLQRRIKEKSGTAMLAEFHALASHPETNALWLRRTLHDEEHHELAAALESGDRAQIARELADVVYVAYGTAHMAGIDLDAALAEVHRANMHKAAAGIRREDGKILKPPDYRPPDMSLALAVSVPPQDTKPAYVETYEGTHPDDPPPPGYYATCGECGWDGPHQDVRTEAQTDADEHKCLVPPQDTNE